MNFSPSHRVERSPPFPETADIETASEDYARRFAGPTGAWMLEVQERLTRRLLRQPPPATILDVGGGHGQLAVPLARSGYSVTVFGSADSCRRRLESLLSEGHAQFVVGHVLDLPFENASFDVVLAFRMLTHCGAWEQLVAELCRVARRAVIVDYPTSQSLNALAPSFFNTKKRIELNTRTWRLFRHAEVRAAFERAGWRRSRMAAQFFLPMVLHRVLRRRGLSAAMETLCRSVGLTWLAGSPVIARFEPEGALRLESSRK